MEQHPVFPRIRLHSDAELAEALGASIVERQTIHEWPLSCVQRVVLEGGERLVYKAQLPPTREPAFYEHAVSSLLTGHRFLAKVDECEIMTLDWIDAPLLRDAVLSEGEWVGHGRELVAQIGAIDGAPPVYLNIGSKEAWSSVVEAMLGMLERLIGSGRFSSIRQERVDVLRQWAESQAVHDCITERPRLIHGDLKAGQVFLEGDGESIFGSDVPRGDSLGVAFPLRKATRATVGRSTPVPKMLYRVIDWQRPVIGPPDVDLVSLLVAQGIDARAHATRETIGVFWFLFLRWAVVAQAELFPDFAGPLFGKWAAVAVRQILDEDAPIPPTGIPPA
jgi:hypothetical protein